MKKTVIIAGKEVGRIGFGTMPICGPGHFNKPDAEHKKGRIS